MEKPNERLRQDREFMAEWLTASLTNWTDHYLPDVLLAIVAGQLDHYSTDLPERLEEKIGELERLGFEVIEAPRLGGAGELGLSWPGVSYVNALYLDKFLYVPTLGLGPEEARLLRGLQKELPDAVRLIPVYAQHMLVHNGEIHCTAAMLRQRPLARPGDSTPDPVPLHLAE